MDAVARAAAVYLFLLLLFRVFGKRSLAQITTFDFVMLLIVAETTQQALLSDDFSVTNCFILATTLLVLDTVFSYVKQHSTWFDRVTEGVPLILLENGKPIEERLRRSRVTTDEILAAARERQGLHRLEQIKFAVLEKSGGISIIPAEAKS